MKTIKVILISSIILLAVLPVHAAKIIMPDSSGNVYLETEKLQNVYTGGNIVDINSDIERDLVVAGNIITINRDIEDDLIVAGGTILVRGKIGGSARIAGGNIVIEGAINEDLVLAGGNISLVGDIHQDLIIAGGNINIEGVVYGDVMIKGGMVMINAPIKGNVKADVGTSFTLGPKAKLEKNLIYRSPKEVEIKDGAEVLGSVEHSLKETKNFPKIPLTYVIIRILSSIIAGLVLIWLFREFTTHVVKESLENKVFSLGFGLAAFLLTPVLIIICLVTIIGTWLAGLLGVSYALSILLSIILAPIVIGSWLMKWIMKNTEYPINWQTVVIGTLVLNALILIPYIGWLLGVFFYLIPLGALYKLVYNGIRE